MPPSRKGNRSPSRNKKDHHHHHQNQNHQQNNLKDAIKDVDLEELLGQWLSLELADQSEIEGQIFAYDIANGILILQVYFYKRFQAFAFMNHKITGQGIYGVTCVQLLPYPVYSDYLGPC
jgi:hypothetical protein